MEDKLAIVRRIIDEHQIIKGHLKLVGNSISAPEALVTLGKAYTDLIPNRLDVISEK